jgi:hypothetical protein
MTVMSLANAKSTAIKATTAKAMKKRKVEILAIVSRGGLVDLNIYIDIYIIWRGCVCGGR